MSDGQSYVQSKLNKECKEQGHDWGEPAIVNYRRCRRCRRCKAYQSEIQRRASPYDKHPEDRIVYQGQRGTTIESND